MPIIIIDGSDADNPCAAYVRELVSDVTIVIQPGYNIGHGRGMCLGIEKTKTRYALIFDSDIELLRPCVQDMLTMMEEDTFGVGDIDKKVDFNRQDLNRGHGYIEGLGSYLQPYFQLIDIRNYKKFYPYVHHGAPCYLTMLDIHKRGLSGKILKQFSNIHKAVKHNFGGTGTQHIERPWVTNEGFV
jgi:GT2 family glycosyltransferase